MSNHPLHSMCSYLGRFPPEVPRAILSRWVPKNGVVLDPFCGSGTTLVEAALTGRQAIGVDLNPLAVALSAAKTQNVTLAEVRDRLKEVARGYPGDFDTEGVPDSVRIFFHPRTLSQLAYCRQTLDPSKAEDIFLRGVLLGILHGKHRKEGGTAYLSIDMPNTFSMSPEYVRKFVKKHRLSQPPVDVFAKARDRATHLLRDGSIQGPNCCVFAGDATNLSSLLKERGVKKVDAILTSPPYLGVLRYGAFNWIRLWFLNHDSYAVDRLLDGTGSLDHYLSFMTSFFMSAAEVLGESAPLVLVVGDVVDEDQELRLAEKIWEELADVVPFKLREITEDSFDEAIKTTRIWGEERKGRATPRDRILVVEKRAKKIGKRNTAA